MTAGELVARRSRATDWIVQDLCPRGSFIIMAGPPKLASKSFKVLHLAECVAKGRPFLGLRTKQSKVFYVGLEDGDKRVERRLHQLGIQENDRAAFYPFFGRDGLNDAIRLLTASTEPILFIVDPLVNWLGLAALKDENDPILLANFIEQYRSICRATGSTILVTDHFDKGWSGMRGSSAKNGSSDGWIDVRPVGKDGDGTTRIKATLRDGRSPELGVVLKSDACAIDCPICSVWENPNDRVQIRFESIAPESLPKTFTLSETQLGANGRPQGGATVNKPPIRRSVEDDGNLIIDLLGSKEGALGGNRWTAAAIAEATKLKLNRAALVLAKLVKAGTLLEPRGNGENALGFRLVVAPNGAPAAVVPIRKVVQGSEAAEGPSFERPESLSDFGPVTEEELAMFNVDAERARAVSSASQRLRVSIGTALALLKKAQAEAGTRRDSDW